MGGGAEAELGRVYRRRVYRRRLQTQGFTDAGFTDAGVYRRRGFTDAGVYRRRVYRRRGLQTQGLQTQGLQTQGFTDAGFTDAGFTDAGVYTRRRDPESTSTVSGSADLETETARDERSFSDRHGDAVPTLGGGGIPPLFWSVTACPHPAKRNTAAPRQTATNHKPPRNI